MLSNAPTLQQTGGSTGRGLIGQLSRTRQRSSRDQFPKIAVKMSGVQPIPWLVRMHVAYVEPKNIHKRPLQCKLCSETQPYVIILEGPGSAISPGLQRGDTRQTQSISSLQHAKMGACPYKVAAKFDDECKRDKRQRSPRPRSLWKQSLVSSLQCRVPAFGDLHACSKPSKHVIVTGGNSATFHERTSVPPAIHGDRFLRGADFN